MFRVSVMYPKSAGSVFDRDYYLNTHVPMAREALKSVVVKEEIWTGTSAPGMPPATYEILLHLYVDSVEGFSTAFQERAGRLMADMPNFRNVQPVLEAEESM